jgi:N-acylneuraminate cytidylyltransferase
MWLVAKDGFLTPLLEVPGIQEPYNQPRQILPNAVQQDGFIDITRPRTIFELNSITGNRILPFFLDRESIDIDHEHEFLSASKQMEGS